MSRPVFENLLMHLVNIEQDQDNLIDEYFPEQTMERYQFKNMLDNYISKMDYLIRYNIGVGEKGDNQLPFVVINSTVDLLDMRTRKTHTYRMVTPDNNKEAHDVSIFSALGKALLLQEVGTVVTVRILGNRLRYRIRSVRFAG